MAAVPPILMKIGTKMLLKLVALLVGIVVVVICPDRKALSRFCALYSAVGALFMLWVALLLTYQPFYVKGVAEARQSRSNAYGAAAMFAVTFVLSACHLRCGRPSAGGGRSRGGRRYEGVGADDDDDGDDAAGAGGGGGDDDDDASSRASSLPPGMTDYRVNVELTGPLELRGRRAPYRDDVDDPSSPSAGSSPLSSPRGGAGGGFSDRPPAATEVEEEPLSEDDDDDDDDDDGYDSHGEDDGSEEKDEGEGHDHAEEDLLGLSSHPPASPAFEASDAPPLAAAPASAADVVDLLGLDDLQQQPPTPAAAAPGSVPEGKLI